MIATGTDPLLSSVGVALNGSPPCKVEISAFIFESPRPNMYSVQQDVIPPHCFNRGVFTKMTAIETKLLNEIIL